MVVVMMMAAHRLRQILHVRELTALGSIAKVGGKLGELGRLGSIAGRRGGLSGGLEVRGDLLRDLLVLGWVRLLQLLEVTHQLSEGRKPAVVWHLRDRRRRTGAQTVVGRVSLQAGGLDGTGENRLQNVGKRVK